MDTGEGNGSGLPSLRSVESDEEIAVAPAATPPPHSDPKGPPGINLNRPSVSSMNSGGPPDGSDASRNKELTGPKGPAPGKLNILGTLIPIAS